MRRVNLLGATGSIGASALDVIARHPDQLAVGALAAHRSVAALASLAARFRPAFVAIADPACEGELRERLAGAGVEARIGSGPAALVEAAAGPHADTTIAAIVGAAGLASTLAAAEAGKRLLLANKEAVVMAGPLFHAALERGGGELLPIDSEHNAVFQCLPSGARRPGAAAAPAAGLRRIVLTASGGPFRGKSRDELAAVTPEMACAHPNWRMGRKISVDSATLMNKGLEVIEARWLFDAPPAMIQVVVHPQSVIHSAVQYVDGSVVAELGNPDMRTPIACAMAWPERIAAGVAPLDFFRVGRLDFYPPDLNRFPCLRLAYDALASGGTAPAILNAANEISVAAFLDRQIAFLDIPAINEAVLGGLPTGPATNLGDVVAADAEGRALARQIIRQRSLG